MYPDDSQGFILSQRSQKEMIVPVSGCHYKGCNPNDDSNDAIYLVEYHIDTLPQFQYIVDKSGTKANFGG